MTVTSSNIVDSESTWTAQTRTTTVLYDVYSDSSSDDSNAILAYSGLPKVDSLLSSDKAQILTSKTASLISSEDDKTKWRVSCTYEAKSGTGGEKDDDEDDQYTEPWDLPPYNVSYNPIGREIVADKAYKDGDDQGLPTVPVINKAEDPYDPTITKQEFNGIVSFTYNLRDFKFEWIPKYIDTINADPITILDINIDSEHARIHSIGAKQVATKNSSDFDIVYWSVDISIEVSNKKIQKEILEAGFNQIVAGVKTKITITDDDGEQAYPSMPQTLDADGAKLAVGEDAIYTPFKINYPANWSTLAIPKARNTEVKNAF